MSQLSQQHTPSDTAEWQWRSITCAAPCQSSQHWKLRCTPANAHSRHPICRSGTLASTLEEPVYWLCLRLDPAASCPACIATTCFWRPFAVALNVGSGVTCCFGTAGASTAVTVTHQLHCSICVCIVCCIRFEGGNGCGWSSHPWQLEFVCTVRRGVFRHAAPAIRVQQHARQAGLPSEGWCHCSHCRF